MAPYWTLNAIDSMLTRGLTRVKQVGRIPFLEAAGVAAHAYLEGIHVAALSDGCAVLGPRNGEPQVASKAKTKQKRTRTVMLTRPRRFGSF